MAADGSVTYSVKYETADAQKRTKKLGKNVKDLDKEQKDLTKSTSGLSKAMKFGGLAILGVVAGLGTLLLKTTANLDNIDKMSQKIGFTSKAYQEWDFILSQNGASIDGLQPAMKTLSKAIFEAGEGTGTYVDALAGLGLEYDDLAGLSPEDQFQIVFDALADVEDQSTRTALASELLGRAATELSPAFNLGSEAIEKQRQAAHDLGLVMEDDTIAAGVKLTDSLDQLKRVGTGLLSQFLVPAIDVINNVVQGMIDFAKWGKENETTLQILGVVFGTIIALLLAYQIQIALATAGTTLWGAIAGGATAITSALGAAFAFLTSPIGLIILAIAALIAIGILIVKNWDVIKEFLLNTWEKIKEVAVKVWEGLKNFFTKLIDGIVAFFKKFGLIILAVIAPFIGIPLLIIKNWDVIKKFFGDLFSSIGDKFGVFVDKIKEFGQKIVDFFVGIGDAIKSGIQRAVDFVKSILNNVIISPFNKLIGAMNKIPGVSFNTIPLLAQGGNIISGGAAIVGENGAELVELNPGARVTPLTGNQSAGGMQKTINVFFNGNKFTNRGEMRKTAQFITTQIVNTGGL